MATAPHPTTPATASSPTASGSVAAGPTIPAFHLPSYLLGLITALLLLGTTLFFWPRPQPAALELQAPPASVTTPDGSATPLELVEPTASPLVVFVSGAVLHPGLYTLAPHARIGDAIAAAGGLLPQVDPALLNQAQPLVDGAQLHIPPPTPTPTVPQADDRTSSGTGLAEQPTPAGEAREEPVAGPPAGLRMAVPLVLPTLTPAQSQTENQPERAAAGELPVNNASAASEGAPGGSLINVNTATAAELESLPAIGPAKAQAIIANRPYATVDDLDRVPGIGPATLEQIRPLVTTQ